MAQFNYGAIDLSSADDVEVADGADMKEIGQILRETATADRPRP
jgi:hypothetical protein